MSLDQLLNLIAQPTKPYNWCTHSQDKSYEYPLFRWGVKLGNSLVIAQAA
jgi:hypothetical protein